jgi:hypothetical protein
VVKVEEPYIRLAFTPPLPRYIENVLSFICQLSFRISSRFTPPVASRPIGRSSVLFDRFVFSVLEEIMGGFSGGFSPPVSFSRKRVWAFSCLNLTRFFSQV